MRCTTARVGRRGSAAGPIAVLAVVLTGASFGLGLATARALAEMGRHTVLVCRDRG